MRMLSSALVLALCLACVPAGAQGSAAGSLASNLPLRRDAASATETGSWTTSGLLVALTGAAGAWAWWRRSARRRPAAASDAGKTAIQRLASQALTPQASVHAVRWNGEELLLGCTAQQVTLLSRKPVAPLQGDDP